VAEGFISWFYAVIFNKIRNACKNIFLKMFVHSLGALLMIAGLYFLITTMPSITSAEGLILFFIGFIIFLIPLGVK
jgi:hypothetical protein